MERSLNTSRLTLRPATPEDIPFLLALHRLPETTAYETNAGLDDAQIRRRFNNQVQAMVRLPEEGAMLWIVYSGCVPIGDVSISCNWEITREWELGYHLLPAYWGLGYAAEAVQAAVSFAFSHFRIHRLAAFIHAGNTRSRKLAARIGMRLEGRIRDTRLVDGVYGDECVYGFLESGFIKR